MQESDGGNHAGGAVVRALAAQRTLSKRRPPASAAGLSPTPRSVASVASSRALAQIAMLEKKLAAEQQQRQDAERQLVAAYLVA